LLVCNLYFWLTIFGVFNLILPMPCCKSFSLILIACTVNLFCLRSQ
jgi:hypothetical protein